MCAHHFHFLHEAEGTGAGDFFHIRCAGEIDFKGGVAAVEYGVVKIDGKANFKAVVRSKAHPFARLLHFHWLQNTQEAFFGLLIHDARILQQIQKRQAGAVHNRDFRRIQFNQHIIDAVGGQCRH